MKKEAKAMLFLVGGIGLVEFGTGLLTPDYWILGLIIGILGLPLFGLGAYWSVESVVESMKQFIKK